MNRKTLAVLMAISLVLTAAASLAADKPQTKCPVSGEAIDMAKSPHVDYQGQRIYFCCDKCPVKFKADPEKYFDQIAKDGIVLESVQKECPLSGEDIDKKVYADYKGRRVYFCCSKCKAKFEKDPTKYLAKLPGEQPAPTSVPSAK